MKKLISGIVIGLVLSISGMTFACGASYKQLLECDINISEIFVNGQNIEGSVKSEIKCITVNGVTYLPARAISENLYDIGIYYDKKTKRIDINYELYAGHEEVYQ